MTDIKRAPAPTWPALRALLSGLEVGESGVLRLPVEPPAKRSGHVFCKVSAKTWAWYEDRWGGEDYGHQSPPLRPGRYWTPERWRWAFINGLLARNRSGFQGHYLTVQFSDFGVLEYRRDWRTQFAPFPPLEHPSYEPSRTGILFGPWRSPAVMPARAARLACSVGEERVEGWCDNCGGEGKVPYPAVTLHGDLRGNPPSGYAKWDGKSTKAKPCPACGGTPPTTWVYPVERTEVEHG